MAKPKINKYMLICAMNRKRTHLILNCLIAVKLLPILRRRVKK